MNKLYYYTFSSPFDKITIIWNEVDSKTLIQRIFLSDNELKSEDKAKNSSENLKSGDSNFIDSLSKKMIRFLNGSDVKFKLDNLDFNQCFEIQKKVLIAEYNIPRGWVSTYKRKANQIGISNGARVVGNSLAKNPFPIIIPCHRAIKSNGELGGYQGGLAMKRLLLEFEGIEFSNNDRVVTRKIFY